MQRSNTDVLNAMDQEVASIWMINDIASNAGVQTFALPVMQTLFLAKANSAGLANQWQRDIPA